MVRPGGYTVKAFESSESRESAIVPITMKEPRVDRLIRRVRVRDRAATASACNYRRMHSRWV